jgi:hypothetical protein
VPDPLNLRREALVQTQDLLPVAVLARCSLSWQHQAVMDVGSYDHPFFSLVIPLAETDGRDVHDWTLGSELEVVGVDQVQALPRPPQHME